MSAFISSPHAPCPNPHPWTANQYSGSRLSSVAELSQIPVNKPGQGWGLGVNGMMFCHGKAFFGVRIFLLFTVNVAPEQGKSHTQFLNLPVLSYFSLLQGGPWQSPNTVEGDLCATLQHSISLTWSLCPGLSKTRHLIWAMFFAVGYKVDLWIKGF